MYEFNDNQDKECGVNGPAANKMYKQWWGSV